MRNFWALPAVLRIALATQHSFSVFDDLLAFPQYEIVWPDTVISENDATSLLSHHASSDVPPGSQENQDLSKIDQTQAQDEPNNEAPELAYEAIVMHGQRYLCSMPVIAEAVPQNNTASVEEAKAEEEKELIRASDRGFELLEGMRGNCIYYISGWWSYSFCYKDEVRQFHQLPPARGVPIYPPVEDTGTHSFVLGKQSRTGKNRQDDKQKTLGNEQGSSGAMDDEGNVQTAEEKGLEIPRLETKGSRRYMVQQLSGGTVCDLTGKARNIDVQFHCNPQSADRIAMIKETSTCSYLMIVDTPRLCHDVAFMPPQDNLAHPITCQPVMAESQVDAWTTARLAEELQRIDRHASQHPDEVTDNPIPGVTDGAEDSTRRGRIIGDIEVGAKSLVGTQGRVIEKSVVVGGGKETHIATVASSDGTQISSEEMKKLHIVDPADVERFKVNLKKLAGKKGWRLDLVDTPRGREFRGIIDADDDVNQNKKEWKAEEQKVGAAGKEDGGEVMRKQDSEEKDESASGSDEVYKDEI